MFRIGLHQYLKLFGAMYTNIRWSETSLEQFPLLSGLHPGRAQPGDIRIRTIWTISIFYLPWSALIQPHWHSCSTQGVVPIPEFHDLIMVKTREEMNLVSLSMWVQFLNICLHESLQKDCLIIHDNQYFFICFFCIHNIPAYFPPEYFLVLWSAYPKHVIFVDSRHKSSRAPSCH